jgi:hypothetical protein
VLFSWRLLFQGSELFVCFSASLPSLSAPASFAVGSGVAIEFPRSGALRLFAANSLLNHFVLNYSDSTPPVPSRHPACGAEMVLRTAKTVRLKKKLLQEGYDQLSEKIGQLKVPSSDGEPPKRRERRKSVLGVFKIPGL